MMIVFWRRPTGAALRPEELDLSSIQRSRVLHTDGYPVDAALASARTAGAAGAAVVVDAGSLRDGMLDLAASSDAFIASSVFARALTGDDNPHGACRKLAEIGIPLVGVTLGARGYVVRDRGRWIERPAYSVDVVDTTGCGDIFHAGFIHGLLHAWSTDDSLDFGAWAAAMVSRAMGGRAGIPRATDWPRTR
jgi:sulfofructose kinase